MICRPQSSCAGFPGIADNARARAFYERTGFRPTGQALPFPGAAHRTICEMKLDLAAGP